MLKEFLPKVLNPDYLSTFSQLSHIEQGMRLHCIVCGSAVCAIELQELVVYMDFVVGIFYQTLL